MKKIFLLVLSCFVITLIYSQNITKEQTVKEYTVSGGVLGALNWSEFQTKNISPSIDYDLKTGFAVGAWLNFPIAKAFSVEPQVLFSSYSYHTDNPSTWLLLNDGKIRYISVPLLLKLHAGDKFAVILGPQVDFLSSLKDNNARQEGDFKRTSFSAFGGVEVFPHGPVTIFGRYIHGFTNMSDLSAENGGIKYENQNIQAGLKIRLFGNKPKATYQATSTTVILDRDNDGINDDVDKCPDIAGLAKYEGCPIPDTDKDGINDEEDKCPNEPGTAKYNGCPIPDTDKDGINDEEDKCPNEAGPASNNGCPVKDRDGDGVNDDVDKCPDVAGPASNNGCPVVEISQEVNKLLGGTGQAVYFNSNSSKLSSASNESLNKVAAVLKNNPDVKIKIEGHTDNAEKDADNLSTQRAEAVKTYLVSKGVNVEKIKVEGSGSTTPIADNNTAAGKTKNRRVEIKIKD